MAWLFFLVPELIAWLTDQFPFRKGAEPAKSDQAGRGDEQPRHWTTFRQDSPYPERQS